MVFSLAVESAALTSSHFVACLRSFAFVRLCFICLYVSCNCVSCWFCNWPLCCLTSILITENVVVIVIIIIIIIIIITAIIIIVIIMGKIKLCIIIIFLSLNLVVS